MARVWWIVGAMAVGASGIVLADGGGPDSAGWSFLDSTETDGPPSAWVAMDDATPLEPGPVVLPFAFAMGGVDWTTAFVDSDGGLLFSGAGSGCPGSADWVGVRSGGRAATPRVRTLGRYPRRGHAVDWDTTQVVLMEGLSEAVVHVESLEDDAVVGVQAAAGAGLAWSCGSSARLGGRSAWFSLSEARTAAHLRSTRRLAEAWWGSRAAEFFGESVAAGDTNDDGLDDVLVGQPEVSTAHLFLGSRTATRTDSDDAALRLLGDDDRLGDAVVLADVDGDGLDDAIVGAPDFDSVGTVAVFLAASGLTGVRSIDDADWRLDPPPELGTGAFGAVLHVGDVTGDGVPDLVVGAPDAGVDTLFVGAVFVVDGAAFDGDRTMLLSEGYLGSVPGDEAGLALGSLEGGLVVGAPGAAGADGSSGVVYVLDPDATPGELRDIARLRLDGASSSDRFGTSVAGGVLRSGADGSLVVGAVGAADRGARTGAVYVFDDAGALDGTRSALEADAIVTGPTAASATGASVTLGALDDDPELELVIGATGGTSALGGGGMIGVFRTPPDGDVDLNAADHRLYSPDAGGELGTAVAIAADIQGDGHPDLLVAAPLDSPGARVGAGAIWVWPFVPAYLDDDADGFVAHPAGGLDCDDGDPSVHPNAPEVVGDWVDNDCDGWVDDAVVPRQTEDGWRYDLGDVLGVTSGVFFDFEDTVLDEAVDDHYASEGLTLYASGAERSKGDIWGAAPVGTRGVRVTADASANDLVMTFGAPVDAVALRIIDAESDLRMDAVMGDELIVDGYHFAANGPDVPGGVYQAFTFARPIERFRIAAATANGWGVDNVEVVFSAGSDRDGDGLSAEDGDCNDFDAAVGPGATEVLGDGIDNDCDGVLDGGDADVFLTESSFAAAISILGVRIDFEDLAIGTEVRDHYRHLGVSFAGDVVVDTSAGGSPPRDAQLGRLDDDTVVLAFTEAQPALALWVLDAVGEVSLEARRDG
ncbi:MAG: MopE-related protein, partial [Myxococcota bacterium]|nr:MopE-related protein [Myxococcota bacterium]